MRRQNTLAIAAPVVAHLPLPVITGGILLAAREMTAGHRRHHLVPAETRRAADAMTAERHPHLALGGTTIDVVTAVAVTAEIVVSHPRGIVGAVATRFRGVLLVVGATNVNVSVSVRRHVEITHGKGTGTVLVNTTVGEMIHGTDTRIAVADANDHAKVYRVSTFMAISYAPWYVNHKNLAPLLSPRCSFVGRNAVSSLCT